MANPPTPRNFIPGEIEVDGYLNAGLRDPIVFLRQPPICTVYTSAATSINSSTSMALAFDSVQLDLYAMHNNPSFPARVYPTYAGWHVATFNGGWSGSANGYRQAKILVNDGATPFGESDVPSVGANGMYQSVTTVPFYCNGSSDFVDVWLWQNSGVALNMGANSFFSVEWRSA